MSHSSIPLLGPLESWGVNTKIILAVLGLVMMVTAFVLLDVRLQLAFSYALASAPIWLPIITFYLFFEWWLLYVRKEFDLNYGRTTVEVKIPQEIYKSPEAMELILRQFNQTAAPDNHKETYIDGKHPPTTSLELVSRGGEVKFYINMPKKRFKDLFETQLYAHYPGIEVHELEVDYTAEIPWDPKRFTYFSLHMGLKKADAFPLKTYIEYGLDKLPKEEEKVDPLNTVLEMLASISPEEHVWIQILIEANKEWTFKEGVLVKKPDWKGAAKKEITKIIEEANARVGVRLNPEKGTTLNMMNLTDSEKDTIRAIERSLNKLAFNTAIRCIYICPPSRVRIGDIIPRIITAWKAFDDISRNAVGVRWRTDFDWPWWQDPHGHRRAHMKKNELDEYKRRAYTPQNPPVDDPKVMTTEELATLFHFPGKVATTPSLGRLPSKRAEAPANLPTGTYE